MSPTHPLVIKLKAEVSKYDAIAKSHSEMGANATTIGEMTHCNRWCNYYNGKAQGLEDAITMISDYLGENDTTLEEQSRGN